MALDSELLDKFERDWNDALAHYEARTTASRMGNVHYDPASRTFAPQEVHPEVASGIRSELFGPLQDKWGLLQEGSARSRATTATQSGPKVYNTRDGLVSVDAFGNAENIFNVPRTERAPQRNRTEDMFMQDAFRTRQALMSKYRTPEEEVILANLNKQIEGFRQPQQQQNWQVNPETIPTGSPVSVAAPAAPATGFIGAPSGFDEGGMGFGEANAFSAPAAVSPAPAASGLKRFKWIQGRLQPQ